ncbi:hypothetical protein ACH4S9_24835 [Streptomyces sp. NPDC021225]|uniref:hypothetical protein n=1 Tax=Streptomyces sp. NPDC021225 TaxID=3365121 RepID=UPI003788344A
MNMEETEDLWRAALANRDPHAIERLLRCSAALAKLLRRGEQPGSIEAAELRGLLLLGGDGDVPFAADSPWDVPVGAGLTEAMAHLWAPVAGSCPRFLAALRAEVLGLALVAVKGEYLLAYLYLADRSGDPPRDLADLPLRSRYESLEVLWGTAPTRFGPTDVVPTLDEPLPAAVRDLAAVHASLTSFDFDLRLDRFTTTLGASTLANYEDEDPDDYDETDDFVRAVNGEFDRWIRFCTCDSAAEAYFLDMADRDADGTPRVALSGLNGTSERPGDPFWDWVDEALPSLIFCL